MLVTLISLIEKRYYWRSRRRGGELAASLTKLMTRCYQMLLILEEAWRRWLRVSGVTRTKRKTPVIVSLTSMQSRLPWLHLTLASLMRQTVKPDKIVLHLRTEDIGKVPDAVLALRQRGLEIIYLGGKDDLRSCKRLIPSLKRFPNALIMTADDDMMYPRRWFEKLYAAHLKEPEYVHCYRAHKILKTPEGRVKSYLDWQLTSPNEQGPSSSLFATNCGGILLSLKLLHKEVLNEKMFLSLSPYQDDVWIYAMALMNGTQIKKVSPYSAPLLYTYTVGGWRIADINNQSEENLQNYQNDRQFKAVFDHYALWQKIA